jgi:vacuolar-type H+-ATPase subunit H
MATPHGSGTSAAPGPDSDLGRLIALEQELASRQEQARAENAALVEAARRDAAALLEAVSRELETEVRERTEASRRETAERIAAIEAEGRAACARYEALTPADIDRDAAALVAWLLQGMEPAR